MLIEEIIRSCRSAQVAEAAVASISPSFALDVAAEAETRGMGVGEFTSVSVQRFACHGGEYEMRDVLAAMTTSQEPILDGLHRILSIMIDAEARSSDERPCERRTTKPAAPRIDLRRERYCA